MTTRLGVDLGTTWTAAAVTADGRTTPVGLGSAGPAMPSVVAIVDGKPVAGEAAVRAGTTDPTAVAREFKRRLGDTTPIVLGGTPYGAETLTGSCPDCNSQLEFSEGCVKCHVCGYSECG